jgi:GAF domain-containing protein
MTDRAQLIEQYLRLQSVTDVALSHLDLDALLGQLLLRVRDALEADTCAVLMLDEDTNDLVARSAIGIEEEVEQGVRIPVGQGFAGQIAASRQPVFLPDVDHADVLNPILRQKGIKSLLGVPLLLGGEVIGVMHVGSLTPREFTADDSTLLQLVADRVARAVEHARAFEAERTARIRLESVQAVTDTALAHLELHPLLGALLPRIHDVLGVDTVAVLLLEEETDELVATAAVGIEEEVEQGVRIPVGKGFAGRVAAGRRPVVLGDVDHSDVLNPILREKGIKSLLGVPLLVHGGVVGVLHVGTLTPREFSEHEIELLQLAADRAAIAIEHARIYAAERETRLKLERLQVVTDIALAHLELEELLAVLLPRIRDALQTDTCAVLLLDEENKDLVARAALGIEEEVEQGVRIPLGKGFAGRIAQSGQPVILDDLAEADVFNPILREKGITSMLGVPLLAQSEVIGVLHVGTLTPRRFGQDDIELLQLVAERVAVAIERAQLHEELLLLDELRANFVAIASHELRTPAASVYGAVATIVERGDELPPEAREQLLQIAYEQGERLSRLLDQLLDLSRLDSRRIRVSPRPVVLHSVLSKIAREAVPQGTPLELNIPEDLAVIADPLVLDRVVSNLLVNAVRYGRPPIVVSAEQRDRHVRVAVEDRGSGVPEDLRARLFDRFERGDDAHGTGLGLSIARAYARAHGGDLFYEPTDDGSRFELLLPRV